MKIFKYLLMILIMVLLLINIYNNYLFYKIPYNPFAEFSAETPKSFVSLIINPSEGIDLDTAKVVPDSDNAKLIFDYLIHLELVPIKPDAIPEHGNTYFWGALEFGDRQREMIQITDIYMDDLTTLYIGSDRPKFKNGYYKIINGEFDYKHIESLLVYFKNHKSRGRFS